MVTDTDHLQKNAAAEMETEWDMFFFQLLNGNTNFWTLASKVLTSVVLLDLKRIQGTISLETQILVLV